MYTLESFNESYLGLAGDVTLYLKDSAGFTTEKPLVQRVTVVVDTEAFYNQIA